MNKLKMIYDASIITQTMNSKSGARAGLFFCALNILRVLSKNNNIEITLLVHEKIRYSGNSDLELLISSFSHITMIDISIEDSIFNKNIKNYKEAIKTTKNIYKIIILLLKIIKNKFKIIRYKMFSIKINDFDIYFSPVFGIPDVITNNHLIKKFIVLHDCIPYLKEIPYPPLSDDDWYAILIRNLNNKTYYLCNSKSTKNDFLKLFGDKLDKEKLFVIPHASSNNFTQLYDKVNLKSTLKNYNEKLNHEDKYIFSLCTLDPRKNLIFTIKCYIKFIKKHKINDLKFYLGGGHFYQFIEQFKIELSEYSSFFDKIILLGYIDDNDVNIFYSNALFFTYLSQYEGFGVPPLEAMQAGTPVITSNNSSLPEVVGDAAIMIDYNSEEQCIKAFEDLYFNEDIRKNYIKKGIERAKLFSWDKTVDHMYNLIDI